MDIFTLIARKEKKNMNSLPLDEQTENIGARRLHTIMEKLLEDISYQIPDIEDKHIVIDPEYVRGKFSETIRKDDIDRFIL